MDFEKYYWEKENGDFTDYCGLSNTEVYLGYFSADGDEVGIETVLHADFDSNPLRRKIMLVFGKEVVDQIESAVLQSED